MNSTQVYAIGALLFALLIYLALPRPSGALDVPTMCRESLYSAGYNVKGQYTLIGKRADKVAIKLTATEKDGRLLEVQCTFQDGKVQFIDYLTRQPL